MNWVPDHKHTGRLHSLVWRLMLERRKDVEDKYDWEKLDEHQEYGLCEGAPLLLTAT